MFKLKKTLVLFFLLGLSLSGLSLAANSDECANLSGSAKQMCEGFASDLAQSKAASQAANQAVDQTNATAASESAGAAGATEQNGNSVQVTPPQAQPQPAPSQQQRTLFPTPKLPTLPGTVPAPSRNTQELPIVTIQKAPAAASKPAAKIAPMPPAAETESVAPVAQPAEPESSAADATNGANDNAGQAAPAKESNGYNIY